MKKKFYLGIDVGATFTKIALVDDKSRIVAKTKISSRGFSRKDIFVNGLKNEISRLLSAQGLSFSKVKGMGLGLPGPIDSPRGVVLSLTNITGWKNFPLAGYLRRSFSMPVFIENDANCMALAESRIGAAKGASFAFCLTLGTGVGGGLIMDREIYRSPYFLGGEIGHVPVTFKGPPCPCGGFACLERYVGNRAILARARKRFKKNVSLE